MENKNIIAIISARDGSKGIPKKNIIDLGGFPLIAYSIAAAKLSKLIDRVIVSTDSEEIAEISRKYGAEAPFLRPKEFARDDSPDIGLFQHAVDWFRQNEGYLPEYFIHFRPTTPLREPEMIDQAIRKLLDNKEATSLVSGNEAESPYKQFQIKDDFFEGLFPDDPRPEYYDLPRQAFPSAYHPNGYIDIIKTQVLSETGSLHGPKMLSFITPVVGDIDCLEDLAYVESDLSRKKYKIHEFLKNMDNKPRLKLNKSLELLARSKKVIPCATQTLSKGYTQWSVGASPLFLQSAKGCKVYDVDGNAYIDYGMALGPLILGYADPDINRAVEEQVKKGVLFTLCHPLEIKAAEMIIENVPCAEMVRFGKNGSDVTTAAVKLARAYTGKEKIIVCGYHGWQDWYIATTERNAGIPKCMKDLAISLKYNDFALLEKIISENKGEIAGLIMEPVGAVPPKDNFLEKVRKITKENNIVLIFDEMFTGFRWSIGGAQQYFNVIPDLACFAKAISNGFPISCVTGKREIMEKFEHVFFSFTYAGEVSGLAAIVATINKLKENKVHDYIEKLGSYLKHSVNDLIVKYNLADYISIQGYPFKTVFNFTGDENCNPLEIKTYFQQECAKRGVLFIGYHLVSYAHKKEDIDFTLKVYDEVFSSFKKLVGENKLKQALEGEVITQIFKNVGDRSTGIND